MVKENVFGYTVAQLEKLMVSLGEKPYKGRQLFKWIYKIGQCDFDLMSDLPKGLRGRLIEKYTCRSFPAEEIVRSDDGTQKFLFRLHDGHPIETVLIPDDEVGRRTACVSSQAGCALGCRFCATATMGWQRDLTVGVIIGQLMYLRNQFGNQAFTNVVFMGMGEPLLNFENVIQSVGIIADGAGLAHAAKKVTISTCGISPGIRKLADTGCKARLAVSLNAAIQEKRVRIMPIAGKHNLDELKEALRYYTRETKTRVTLEYILFKGFNDTMEDVNATSAFIRGIPCKINILAYNPVSGLDFDRPSDERVDWFAKQLYPRAPAVTVRKSRGSDINAACGQLAGGNIGRR